MDEKWFYCNSGRCFVRVLPLQEGEELIRYSPDFEGGQREVGEHLRRQAVSRKYETKVMLIAVVCCPNASKGINGMVCLERIQELMTAEKRVVHHNYSELLKRNKEIEDSWKNVVTADQSGAEMIAAVKRAFPVELGDKDLVLNGSYTAVTGKRRGQKLSFTLTGDQKLDDRGNSRPTNVLKKHPRDTEAMFNSLTLGIVKCNAGDQIMVDTTCDGRWMEEFMLERLPEKILKVMEKHQGYPAVQYLMGLMGRPPQSYATIQMDNAGGHGSKECIKRYESGLLDKGFKVNFQPPNSPDLNVLDFGVWRGLQAEVDKLHRAKKNNPDVLTATCLEAWRKWGDEKQPSTSIFGRE